MSRHERLFGTTASSPWQYAAVAVIGLIFFQITACILTRQRARRLFDTWSVLTVGLVCSFTLVVRGAYFPRQVLSTALVCAWSIRLAFYLFRRQTSTANVGAGEVLPRILWATVCSLPVVLVNEIQIHAYHITASELMGCLICVLALAFETVADTQKNNWHTKIRGARPGKSAEEPPVCHTGLWALSRHPNLFGELVFHWGVYFVVQPVLPIWILVAPVLNTFMLLMGGFKKQERQRNGTYALFPSYASYRFRTSPIFPMPQRAYASFTAGFKNALCCEVQDFDL